jgi:hypothetical protein
MAVREEIRFSFDTQDAKYLGTAFSHTAFCKVERFQVVSKQSFQEVFSLGSASPRAEVAGSTQVGGEVWVWPPTREGVEQALIEQPPWSVRLNTYSPVDDYSYVARVLGIHIIDARRESNLYRCNFIATKAEPWQKIEPWKG